MERGRGDGGGALPASLRSLLAASSFSPASTSALSIVSLGFLPGFTRLHFVLAILGFRWDALARPPLSKTPAANHRCPLPFGIAYVAKCWARAWQIYWTMCSVSRCGNSPNLHEHSKSEKNIPPRPDQTRSPRLARPNSHAPNWHAPNSHDTELARPDSHAQSRTRHPKPARPRLARAKLARRRLARTKLARTKLARARARDT